MNNARYFRFTVRWLGRSLIALLLLSCLGASSFGQNAVISGRVLDKETGAYLQGVSVRLDGTDLSVSTNIQGEFVFRRLSPGSYIVETSYIGKNPAQQLVSVKDGETTTLEIQMESELIELETFRLEGTFQTGTYGAINQQRAASGVINVINEDQFTQMNDGNIGLALRRMPGLSVDTDGSTETNRYVNIRGFDGSLNAVTLDGNRLPSSENGDPHQRGTGTAYSGAARNFALDDAPASAITNVEIVKAPTPDMDGDALGGSVNLITRSAFQRTGRSVDYMAATSYSELRGEWGVNGSITYNDILNMFGGTNNLGISATLAYFDQEEGFDNRDYDYAYLGISDDLLDTSAIRPYDGSVNDYLSEQIKKDMARTGQIAIGFNEDTEFNNYSIARERLQFSASFDLRLNENTELYFKPTYTTEQRSSKDFRHHLIMDSSDSPGLNHGDKATPLQQYVSLYRFDDANFDSGNYTAFLEAATSLGVSGQEFTPGDSLTLPDGSTISFNPGALVRLGDDPNRISTVHPLNSDKTNMTTWNPDGTGRGAVRYRGTFEERDISLWNMNFGGVTHTEWGVLDYNAYYARTTQDQDYKTSQWQRNGFQFMVDRTAPNAPYETDYKNITHDLYDRANIPTGTSAVDRFRDRDMIDLFSTNTQDMYGAQLNLKWDLPANLAFSGSIKTGAKFRGNKFEYDYDRKVYDFNEKTFPFADYALANEFDPVFGNENQRIPFVPNTPEILKQVDSNPDWFKLKTTSITDSINRDYSATEDTYAGYLMSTIQAGGLEVISGFRYEFTDFSTEGYYSGVKPGIDLSTLDAFNFDESAVALADYEDGQKYEAFLPSVHLKYSFTNNVIVRASWGKTYARPDTKDMTGTKVIDQTDPNHIVVTVPNPDLPPQRSENYDLSVEYYSSLGSFYQLGFFYKDMTNYAWMATLNTVNYPGFEGIDTEVNIPMANTNAVNYGVEATMVQPLKLLSDYLDGFTVNATATYTESEAEYYTGRTGPTVGHSYVFYNLSLAYEKHRIFARISYLYRSRFLENISISDFVAESEAIAPKYQYIYDDAFINPATVDAELSYRITDSLQVFCNVTNITEGINSSRQGHIFQYPEDAYPHKRRWTFGVKGSF
ncbi:MAG: TonB-dependent receptor [Opitutales bacterium]|nr:TonB-dependent receptor [Opitutales bacterium]